MSDNYLGRISFEYEDWENRAEYSKKVELTEDEITWCDHLSHYISFLEGVFGYPIRHKIAVYDKFNTAFNWHGPTFTKDTVDIPTDCKRLFIEDNLPKQFNEFDE